MTQNARGASHQFSTYKACDTVAVLLLGSSNNQSHGITWAPKTQIMFCGEKHLWDKHTWQQVCNRMQITIQYMLQVFMKWLWAHQSHIKHAATRSKKTLLSLLSCLLSHTSLHTGSKRAMVCNIFCTIRLKEMRKSESLVFVLLWHLQFEYTLFILYSWTLDACRVVSSKTLESY